MKTKIIVKALIGVIIIGGGMGYFIYQTMQSSWAYYYSVDEFSANKAVVNGQSLRIAGTVKSGSISRDLQKMNLTFTLSGTKTEIPVSYIGTVPDNFEEDKEVVIQGRLDTKGIFQADLLLTRCESKYKVKLK
jgi:cytochrome c-type biogenesis protein CcmE